MNNYEQDSNGNNERLTAQRQEKLVADYFRVSNRILMMWQEFKKNNTKSQKLALYDSLFNYLIEAYNKNLLVYKDQSGNIVDNFWEELFVWIAHTLTSYDQPPKFESISEQEMVELYSYLVARTQRHSQKIFIEIFSAKANKLSVGPKRTVAGKEEIYYLPGFGPISIVLN
jgi:hypothetical protein